MSIVEQFPSTISHSTSLDFHAKPTRSSIKIVRKTTILARGSQPYNKLESNFDDSLWKKFEFVA